MIPPRTRSKRRPWLATLLCSSLIREFFGMAVTATLVGTAEAGNEGNEGIFYTPLPGQPGYNPSIIADVPFH